MAEKAKPKTAEDRVSTLDLMDTAIGWLIDHPRETAAGCLGLYLWGVLRSPAAALAGFTAGATLVGVSALRNAERDADG